MGENILQKKILIIDDESLIRQVFSYYLEDQGYEIVTADNGRTGIELLKEELPQIILTDLRMPEANGMDVLKAARELDPEIPVVVISGVNSLDDAINALRQGAWDYLIKPVRDLSILSYTIEKSLEKSSLLKENRQYREHLEELVEERTMQLQLRNEQLDLSRRQIVGILSQAAEYRDFETGDHFLRVSEFSACIARGMGWDKKDVDMIQLASPVHDIGKIGIPDNILLKKGKLTAEEWTIMKKHCRYGERILTSNRFVNFFTHTDEELEPENVQKEAGQKLIETAANIALYHHEHWNGAGYPTGIKGVEIPVEARITAVADVYDALRSYRPYKDPWPEEDCLALIREESGKQFDPEVVQTFLDNLDKIRKIQNALTE
ncbi:MAG: hypothetical protein B6241_08680 [Spirochaetaceae bacterium 4572_59]|nr:MAG: hypothetical protein B6241_08680 [Spirochaetaceae bacterium 4572_59]